MPKPEKSLRIAALFVSLITILVGVVGFASPEFLTAIRRSYFATASGLHLASAVRMAMGLVLIFAASRSRWPWILRMLGAVMCLQGIAATLLGLEHAQAILEWETMHSALLRFGALIAFFSGGFIASAILKRPGDE